MEHLPKPCAAGCGRPVRPEGTNKEEWGGAIIIAARGMCRTCYNKAPGHKKRTRPNNCVDCARPMRPNDGLVAEWPGTVRHAARGQCDSCQRGFKPRGSRPELGPCNECGIQLRYKGSEKIPGTRVHEGRGKCGACRGRKRRGTTDIPAGTTPLACVSCESPMRPRHSDKAQYPGSKEHAGKGVCRSCESNVRRGYLDPSTFSPVVYPERNRFNPYERPAKEPKQITDPGLLKMRRDREERARRQEQIQRARIAQEAARAQFIASRRNIAA